MALAVSAGPERKVIVVAFGLERISELDVLHDPASGADVFLIVRAILQPDADVLFRLAADEDGVDAASGGTVRRNLEGVEAADPAQDAGELVGMTVGGIEGADAAYRH